MNKNLKSFENQFISLNPKESKAILTGPSSSAIGKRIFSP